MNTKNIAIAAIVIVLLLLLGAAGYLMLSKNTAKTLKTAPKETVVPTKTGQTTKSLMDLLSLGQNLRCTFDTTGTTGTSTKGTVYVSGTKIRGDFTITDKTGKEQQTSMIRVGDTNYVWGSTLPNGIKMTLSLDKISGNTQASQYFNPSQKTNYNCLPWSVDATLFTPPSNIKFTDMTSLLAPKETVTGTQTKTGATDPCSQITDPTAKTACENALKQSGQ
jgi:hypothetical protein